jgi:hypothetical protein
LFVISVYVVGIIPFVIHDVVVDGRTESVASVMRVVSGYNAAEAAVAESVGETTLTEGVEVFSAINARVHPTQ